MWLHCFRLQSASHNAQFTEQVIWYSTNHMQDVRSLLILFNTDMYLFFSSYTGRDMMENPFPVFPELLSSLSPPLLPRSPPSAEKQEPAWVCFTFIMTHIVYTQEATFRKTQWSILVLHLSFTFAFCMEISTPNSEHSREDSQLHQSGSNDWTHEEYYG